MRIGIPTEIKNREYRVSCTPGGVRRLIQAGHTVIVQQGAGQGTGFRDQEYADAGGHLVATAAEVWSSDLVLKVKEPIESEYGFLRSGLLLFTYLHLAADRALTDRLLESRTTGIAYETVQVGNRLPLLEPMSEIAGRMSAIVGAHHLAKATGGAGVLLGGVPGVAPAQVVILGGGSAGTNAARMAIGLGADVTIMEIDHERMKQIDLTFSGRIHTLPCRPDTLAELLPRVDLLIGAVLVPGASAPKLITRAMLRTMRPGSVFVDIAIDQGGCAETSRRTTHDAPTYVEEGVLHYCVANMPGAYARTSTIALTNLTMPYVEALANLGLPQALDTKPGLAAGVNTLGGMLCNHSVAEAHGLTATRLPAMRAMAHN